MSSTQIRPWDAAEHLESSDDIAAYLEAALEDGDAAVVAAALDDIARAKGLDQIACDASLGRESRCMALSRTGNPELAATLEVITALGVRLYVAKAQVQGPERP